MRTSLVTGALAIAVAVAGVAVLIVSPWSSSSARDGHGARTVVHAAAASPAPGQVLFRDDFDRADGLVTNEFAYWNPSRADAVRSPDWELTSGSLLTRAGAGWTGAPDDVAPNATSSNGNDSAVFRLTTTNPGFGNVAVDLDLRLDRFVTTKRTPAVAWDGVHVFLHYQSEYSLYYASIDRRDGTVAIKKKVPGGPSNDGTYYQLATGRHAVPLGAWEHVRATVATGADGSVTIELFGNGTLLARAVDRGTGGPPITAPGKVGLRGDNADFSFDRFTVTAL